MNYCEFEARHCFGVSYLSRCRGMSTLHVINGPVVLFTSHSIQPGLPRTLLLPSPSSLTPIPLSPFDAADRCLKEINYPRSFSPLLSSVTQSLSVPCPTSVRGPSPGDPSCLCLKHGCTVMPRAMTYDTLSLFSRNTVDEFLYTRSILYRTDASFLRNRPSTRCIPPSYRIFNSFLHPQRIHQFQNEGPDKDI